MSTLQVANVYLESTGNNRIQYAGSNSYTLYAGGVGTLAVNTTSITVTGNTSITGNTTLTNITASGNTSAVNITASANVNMAVANVTSNTLTLGTSSIFANGYSRLPNGLLMQWGSLLANTSTPSINFPVTFSSTPFSIVVTPATIGVNTAVTALGPAVATIRAGSTANTTVWWIAIGI